MRGADAGAAAHLWPGGTLVLYGPCFVDGEPASTGNLAFDAELRARDPRWGLRRLGDVVRAAADAGLAFENRTAMPANNTTVVFRQATKAAGGPAG